MSARMIHFPARANAAGQRASGEAKAVARAKRRRAPDSPRDTAIDGNDPADCVRQFPMVFAERGATTELVGYDRHGIVRIKIEVEESDVHWFEGLIMRYVRWRFGCGLRLEQPHRAPAPLDQWMVEEAADTPDIPAFLLE